MPPYTFFEDGGHGWLKVPLIELKELGIIDKISQCSYVYGSTWAYLEEDCDLNVFFQAKNITDFDQACSISKSLGSSGIRNFERYDAKKVLEALS